MIYRIAETTSTNDDAKRPEYRHGDIVWAERQTAGRGQRGHSWTSPEGENLTFTLVLEPVFLPVGEQFLLSEAVTLALTDTFAAFGIDARIKWTNDIYVGDKKLVGILIEHSYSGPTLARTIAGIGINVGQTDGDFGPALSRVATSLEQELGSPVRRADLAVCLLRALDDMYAAFPAAKADYLAEYRARCVTTGHEVYLVRGEERLPAFAESVDEDFALLCRMPDGSRRRVTAGEVSVRGLMGYV